jgi:hypothetical protein
VPTDWKPSLVQQPDWSRLSLTPQEGFLLSRLDGHTSLRELALLTQTRPEVVEELLGRLVREQLVLAPPGPVSGPPAGPPIQAQASPAQSAVEPTASAERESPAQDHEEGEDGEDGEDAEPSDDEPERTAEPEEALAASGATHRQLFESRLHPLEAEERARLALSASEPELSALCFDPVPAVVCAVLDNPGAGLGHARLIATHHRNPNGLERLVARTGLGRDAEVRRLLLRNPQLSDAQLKRLLARRRLLALWKLSIGRDLPERNRTGCSRQLRASFATASAEDRVEVILTTEGRSLAALSGLPIDGKTTALLCARTYSSVLLVQNLARWAVAPPALIAHLTRQPIVQRSPQLRTLLARHPNAGGERR